MANTIVPMEARAMKGKAIYESGGQITRVDGNTYYVNSQKGHGIYDILSTELGWLCSCANHIYRGVKCKHIWAVEFSLSFRKEVQKRITIKSLHSITCVICHSLNIVKHGISHNSNGDIQRFSCKDCGKRFSSNLGFEGMKGTPQIITSALQLYFTGESLRNVQKFLKLQGVSVNHTTIYRWISKYVGLMEKYLENIKPNVSQTWRADELWLKIKGDMKYLFAMMDDETRFWIAQEVADSKFRQDARKLFQLAKEATGKKPLTLITDGLPSYHNAYLKEFWTRKKATRTKHINAIKLQGDMNNNKMERLNGEFRDREKVMRGIKKVDSPIISGYQIYHNYIRPHEALAGHTPAEACGIEIEGDNKWLSLIRNANHVQKKQQGDRCPIDATEPIPVIATIGIPKSESMPPVEHCLHFLTLDNLNTSHVC